MQGVTNRHELRRRATRDSLREVALAKFVERGFDNVTVAEIAQEVGVTERTFYRHFPTKEAVLFQDYQQRLEWLAAALDMRPTTEPLFESVAAAVASFPDDLERVRQPARVDDVVAVRGALAGLERRRQIEMADAEVA